jgi:hypothetical protein
MQLIDVSQPESSNIGSRATSFRGKLKKFPNYIERAKKETVIRDVNLITYVRKDFKQDSFIYLVF